MISPTVQTLLDRMDKFPEEFTDATSDLTESTTWASIDYTRWGGVSKTMLEHHTNDVGLNIFTSEEVNAYVGKLSKLMRKKMEEDVCAKLVKFEEDPRQGELELDMTPQPLPNTYGHSVVKLIEAHKKILGLTPTVVIEDSTS